LPIIYNIKKYNMLQNNTKKVRFTISLSENLHNLLLKQADIEGRNRKNFAENIVINYIKSKIRSKD
jgi:hypothetical protein